MKATFIHLIRQQYPDGIPSMEQHRDLIRVFYMGYVSALLRTSSTDVVKRFEEDYAEVREAKFVPDDSWKWWTGDAPTLPAALQMMADRASPVHDDRGACANRERGHGMCQSIRQHEGNAQIGSAEAPQ